MSTTPDPPSRFAETTHQDRSAATAQRILQVASERFEAGAFDATSVAEIARLAGVSVGGLYRRFRTKADLQRAVAESRMVRFRRIFAEALLPDALGAADAADVVRRYATCLVTFLGGEDRGVLRRLALLLRSDRDLPASKTLQEHNQAVHGMFAEALLARREQLGHPDPVAAIEFTDLAMSAAAREALLHDGMHSLPPAETLVDWLTRLGCSYLQIPIEPA
ncbi:MAG: TetR/AcrR family transcriptional regulator [Planctomycetes bacterium]|nr:TetR/AcrR family transcriptional regulator [Planctomycetota bacterium]